MSLTGTLDDPLLTTEQLADYLSVTKRWIWSNQHLLPSFRVGRELRFRLSEVSAWLETQRENV